MFKNYLTIALRHLMRHKVYTAINVVGLASGEDKLCSMHLDALRYE